MSKGNKENKERQTLVVNEQVFEIIIETDAHDTKGTLFIHPLNIGEKSPNIMFFGKQSYELVSLKRIK